MIKDFESFVKLNESNDNWVLASFPIGKMKKEIDKEWGCNLQIDAQEDIICFDDEDAGISFTIERVPQKIMCPESIEEFLKKKFGFKDRDFIK